MEFLFRPPAKMTEYEAKNMIREETKPKFLRIERKINHKGWQFVHNVIAHPLLAFYRPLGLKLHAYTAEKMYGDDSKEYFVEENSEING